MISHLRFVVGGQKVSLSVSAQIVYDELSAQHAAQHWRILLFAIGFGFGVDAGEVGRRAGVR